MPVGRPKKQRATTVEPRLVKQGKVDQPKTIRDKSVAPKKNPLQEIKPNAKPTSVKDLKKQSSKPAKVEANNMGKKRIVPVKAKVPTTKPSNKENS